MDPISKDPLRASMEWLDDAIQDGDVYDSGVIYRGSTVRGSDPANQDLPEFLSGRKWSGELQ